jgi:hypothetical protein
MSDQSARLENLEVIDDSALKPADLSGPERADDDCDCVEED